MSTFVLAYSGGLDTSVILAWLQVHYGASVVTVTADLGQVRELVGVREKALACGATQVYIDDLKDEFVEDYVWPALKAGALYQGAYPLASALGRPLISKRLVEVAREVGADAIVHGCTGKGNDQVRLEVSAAALAPDLHAIAPLREWDLHSRDEEIAWAQAHGSLLPRPRRRPTRSTRTSGAWPWRPACSKTRGQPLRRMPGNSPRPRRKHPMPRRR